MPRVVHFEIAADDPERASRFYSDTFGWTITKWEGQEDYWLIGTGEDTERGIDGGLMRRGTWPASVINTIDVPSVDEFVARVTANGGTVVAPKMTVPGIGYLAYCNDSEGNVFGLMQMDPAV
jgi:uncharacterized protein